MIIELVNIFRSFFFSFGISFLYFVDIGMMGRENVFFKRWILIFDLVMFILLVIIVVGRCESCFLYSFNFCRKDVKVIKEFMWEMFKIYKR